MLSRYAGASLKRSSHPVWSELCLQSLDGQELAVELLSKMRGEQGRTVTTKEFDVALRRSGVFMNSEKRAFAYVNAVFVDQAKRRERFLAMDMDLMMELDVVMESC